MRKTGTQARVCGGKAVHNVELGPRQEPNEKGMDHSPPKSSISYQAKGRGQGFGTQQELIHCAREETAKEDKGTTATLEKRLAGKKISEESSVQDKQIKYKTCFLVTSLHGPATSP